MSRKNKLLRLRFNSWLGRYCVLLLGVVFLSVALVAYLIKFGGWPWWDYFSNDREHWGQFGDFLGGLLNPIIGLITIWLFTKSLYQNSEMLKAAKEELELARKEIARGVEVQEATKASLGKQIEIAQQEKDFNSAVVLLSKCKNELEMLRASRESDESEKVEDFFRQERFLNRYVDGQFNDLVHRVVNLKGADNIFNFKEKSISGTKCRFVVLSDWKTVRIHVFLPDGDSRSLYWSDIGGHIPSSLMYLDRLKCYFEAAEVALQQVFHSANTLTPFEIRIKNVPGLSLTPP